MPAHARTFRPLTFVPEGDGVMVGSATGGSYALFPPDGAALLEQLYRGLDHAEARDWYRTRYGEDVDLDDFLDTVDELGLLQPADAPAPPGDPGPVRFQRLGKAVFSWPAWLLYAATVVTAVVAMMRHPMLQPRPTNAFFTHSLVLVQLTFLLSQLPALGLHEGFHTLAGRRLGLPSRLSVGVRLYFVVFETHLDGLLGRPRRQRYLPFLAGILADLLWFSGFTLIAALSITPRGTMPLYGRLSLAIAFPTILRLLWQCYVVLRTDLYYAFTTALGCADLHGATVARLRNARARLLRARTRPVDLDQWSARDRAVARWYAPLAGTMTALLLGIGGGVTLVFAGRYAARVAERLSTAGFSASLVDPVVSLAGVVLPLALAAAVELRRRRAAEPRHVPSGTPLTPDRS